MTSDKGCYSCCLYRPGPRLSLSQLTVVKPAIVFGRERSGEVEI